MNIKNAHSPFHGRLCAADRLHRRGAVLREFPVTPPAPRAGVTEVQALCAFRFVDSPPSWDGPAEAA